MTSSSTWADSVFSRCFSSLSACCLDVALRVSTCSSRCWMRSSRLESRLLISFSSALAVFSSTLRSSGSALMAPSNFSSCCWASCRACSAAWCSLRVMRSSMSACSCSLHLSSCSSAPYWDARDFIFSTCARAFSRSRVDCCTCCSRFETSCSCIRMLPPLGAEPPVMVPAGSYRSPSLVTERTRTLGWKLTCLAVSGVSQTR
mmetsp:Transcript_26122/g.75413  ORF Transcript_26122/g.75413 Transcript_26122/m.75413 type:complete len:203 (+) Transcript_26122:1163-1771(+)